MMVYLPSGSEKQQKAQQDRYGTCLHTSQQYAKRSKDNGSAQCAVKFPFSANVGYSFTVHKHSFHSASAGELGERRTIMCALRLLSRNGSVIALCGLDAIAEQPASVPARFTVITGQGNLFRPPMTPDPGRRGEGRLCWLQAQLVQQQSE